MDLQQAEAMRKLLKQTEPVRVLRRKYELVSLSEELARTEKALKSRKKKIFGFGNGNPILENKSELLRQQIKACETDWIEGVLTPITEMERWECLHEYTKIRHFLSTRAFEKELSQEAKKSEQYSIDLISEQVYVASQVECALKKNVNGKLERYFLPGDTSKTDPRILSEIFLIYQKVFVLTESEIKK